MKKGTRRHERNIRTFSRVITGLLLLGLTGLYEHVAERQFPRYSLKALAGKLTTHAPTRPTPTPKTDRDMVRDQDQAITDDTAPNIRITRQQTEAPNPTEQPGPAATGRPPTAPQTLAPDSLLSLWSPSALLGSPGDAAIHPLKRPDRSPPPQHTPATGLPGLPAAYRRSLRRMQIPAGDKPVALTFDLCEQADEVTGYDRDIINLLRAQSVRATFFAGGKWMRSHADKTQQLMADPRFELGNHGWTHGNLRVLTGQAMREQIVWTQAEYEQLWRKLGQRAEQRGLGAAFQAVPSQLRIFRFPFGTCSPESLDAVNDLDLAAVQWDVVSGDAGKGQSTGRMAEHVIQQVKPGSIVVFHANGRGHGTAAALPRILDGLRHRGYRFVTVSELLMEGDPVATDECYEQHPGDNLKYDKLFGDGTGKH